MIETKFTQGPYRYYEGDGSLLSESTGEHVAMVLPWNFVGHQDIQKANGALLESAPRMYQALHAFLAYQSLMQPEDVRYAEKVLAAARCES